MKGFIYIIRSHQTDDVYYGSTTEILCRRMAKHRCQYKQWLNGNFNSISSFDILKYEDAYIELVEEIEFQNKKELHAREGHYIRENKCVNKLVAGRTGKQYYLDNKNKIDEISKQYQEDNKSKLDEYRKQYREDNKDRNNERSKKWLEANKDKRKQWREANKDKIKEYNKLYRESKKVSPE
jgi:hypothetical protein